MEIDLFLIPGSDIGPIRDQYRVRQANETNLEYFGRDCYILTDHFIDPNEVNGVIGWIEGLYPGSYCKVLGSKFGDMKKRRETPSYMKGFERGRIDSSNN